MESRNNLVVERVSTNLATIEEPSVTSTITVTSDESPVSAATIRLKLTKSKQQHNQRRRVSWTTETVDNEMMNKKKSKCCCVYQKPRNWNESSSEDENEDHDCQNCRGHRKTDFNSKRSSESKNTQVKMEDSQAHNHHENCDLHDGQNKSEKNT